jgi:PAS domain S-box-containing protein
MKGNVMRKPLGEEMEFFRQYNEVLFNQLEKKILDKETANQQLRISVEEYRLQFENISDVVFMIGTDFNILSISPSVEKLLGYKAEDFIGHPVSDLSHILTPQSFKRAITNVNMMLKGKKFPATNYDFIAKDGTLKHTEIHGSPLMRDGQVAGTISVARDITERKHAEEALRESEERYRRIAENMSDMVSDVDAEGLFRYISPSHQRILGYRPEDLLGTAAFDKFHPDDKDRVSSVYMEGVITKTDSEAEYRYRHADGHYVWLRSSGHIILDGAGKYLGSIINSSDITKRKQIEDTLEHLVQERTDELSENNKQLVEEIVERKEAEAALRKKTKELQLHSHKLQELNATLKVLLQQREEDRTELEEKVISNVKHLLFPQLETLREQRLDAKSKMHLDILEGNLKNIVSSFSHRLSSKYTDLTPTEIRVANLIREGKTTKEISKFLGSSESAINIHRFHIRRKLGIIRKNINLQSHLSSIS